MNVPSELKPWGDAPHNYGYVLIYREKKSRPYRELSHFKVSGQCCQSNAEDHCEKELGWKEGFLWESRDYRLVNNETWRQMQVRAHLKTLGIKIK